jgi:hypothetical protein
MRAVSPLVAMPGGEPLNLRVFAEHPDESGCGAHECARHELPSRPCAGDSFTASSTRGSDRSHDRKGVVAGNRTSLGGRRPGSAAASRRLSKSLSGTMASAGARTLAMGGRKRTRNRRGPAAAGATGTMNTAGSRPAPATGGIATGQSCRTLGACSATRGPSTKAARSRLPSDGFSNARNPASGAGGGTGAPMAPSTLPSRSL